MKEKCVLDILENCDTISDAAIITSISTKLDLIRNSLSCLAFPDLVVSIPYIEG